MDALLESFTSFDLDQDGTAEIVSLGRRSDLEPSSTSLDEDASVLLVLIEPRLSREPASDDPLASRLRDYVALLREDGWSPVAVSAAVYSGERHQDGKTVLAMRRLFQQVHERFPRFGGAVLIGSFPEAMLVRRWVWKHKSRSVKFGDVTYNKGKGPRATWLAMDPELISPRSDVVLCDLDGRWEEIYREERTAIDSIKLLPEVEADQKWPVFDVPLVTSKFSIRSRSYEDFFWIDDAQYQILEQTDDRLSIQASYELRRPEVTPEDREQPNPIARPEINVSRINPRHVAVSQPASNLDEQGRPRAVPRSEGSPNGKFTRDPELERRLLLEYLDRNIAFRRGELSPEARRAASLTTDLHTPSKRYLDSLSPVLSETVAFPNATAVDCARFLQTPAIVKGVSAHSNPSCSVLMKGYSPGELAELTGGGYWFWKKNEDRYVPTYDHPGVRDRIHFALLRTLWANGRLESAGPTFYVHGGCEAMSPLGAAKHPYDSPSYGGHTQIAESLLFYGNGLALIGRAKVFYDIPRGFGEAFSKGRFGDVLNRYFEIESQDPKLARSVASLNRAYFWSILGDWTLRLESSPAEPVRTGEE